MLINNIQTRKATIQVKIYLQKQRFTEDLYNSMNKRNCLWKFDKLKSSCSWSFYKLKSNKLIQKFYTWNFFKLKSNNPFQKIYKFKMLYKI